MTEHTNAPAHVEHPMTFTERVRLWGGVAVAVVLVIFFVQNLHDVEIKFLWMDWETDLFWALLLSAILGSIATLAVTTIRSRSARQAASRKAKDQAA